MFLQKRKNPPKSKKTQSLSMDMLNGGIDPVGEKMLTTYPSSQNTQLFIGTVENVASKSVKRDVSKTLIVSGNKKFRVILKIRKAFVKIFSLENSSRP